MRRPRPQRRDSHVTRPSPPKIFIHPGPPEAVGRCGRHEVIQSGNRNRYVNAQTPAGASAGEAGGNSWIRLFSILDRRVVGRTAAVNTSDRLPTPYPLQVALLRLRFHRRRDTSRRTSRSMSALGLRSIHARRLSYSVGGPHFFRSITRPLKSSTNNSRESLSKTIVRPCLNDVKVLYLVSAIK